ncbi:MAG: hypothetical protein L6R43_18435 [Planctomycetes bacterium]|nr:hypothetical protein [Planctomycetota bacterium]
MDPTTGNNLTSGSQTSGSAFSIVNVFDADLGPLVIVLALLLLVGLLLWRMFA